MTQFYVQRNVLAQPQGQAGPKVYRLRQTGIHRGGHRRGQGQKHAHPGNSEQKSGKQKIATYMLIEGQNGIDTKL